MNIRDLCPDWLANVLHLTKEVRLAIRIYQNYHYITASVVAVILSGKLVNHVLKSRRLTAVRNEAKQRLSRKKTKWWGRVLSQVTAAESQKITSMTFDQLKLALHKGQVKVIDVLRAFQYRAAVNDQKYNFICEPIDEAEEWASFLDSLLPSEREKMPLFGLPLSVKECVSVLGYNSNSGCSRMIGIEAEEDAVIVRLLREAGAVPFIRCNVPQGLMSFSCSNPVYGTTRNPHNPSREPGGSSGGDGVAVATGSTVLAVGTDIGGSVRIPAAWCGHATLKPTAGLVSYQGIVCPLSDGQTIVKPTVGPMALSVEAIIDMVKVMTSYKAFQLDPTVGYHQFKEQDMVSLKKLTIGYFDSFAGYTVCSAAKRAVKESCDILRAHGHELVPYELPKADLVFPWYSSAVFGDGGHFLNIWFANDEWTRDFTPMLLMLGLPHVLKKAFNVVYKFLFPRYVYEVSRTNEGIRSVADWWSLQETVQNYRQLVLTDLREKGLDAVICPSTPGPAMTIGLSTFLKFAVAYTIPWNLLNFPAGVVPVSKVTDDDVKTDHLTYPESDIFNRTFKQDLEGTEGLPISVQVVSIPYHEERCLRIMRELEEKVVFSL